MSHINPLDLPVSLRCDLTAAKVSAFYLCSVCVSVASREMFGCARDLSHPSLSARENNLDGSE